MRGTSFEFDTVNISVQEGTVAFGGNNAGPETIVPAGFTTFVGTDGTAANPTEVAVSTLAPPAPVGVPPPEVVTQPPVVTTGSLSIDIIYR